MAAGNSRASARPRAVRPDDVRPDAVSQAGVRQAGVRLDLAPDPSILDAAYGLDYLLAGDGQREAAKALLLGLTRTARLGTANR